MSLRGHKHAGTVVEFTVRSRATPIDRFRQAVSALCAYLLVCIFLSTYDVAWQSDGYLAMLVVASQRLVPRALNLWLSELREVDVRVWCILEAGATLGIYASHGSGAQSTSIGLVRSCGNADFNLHSRIDARDAVRRPPDPVR